MLEHLYKKLHLIFISSIMAIIIVVIGILCKDFLDNERKNDSIFFERLSMLMLYELENPQKSPQEVIWPYEDNYSIFAVLKPFLLSNRYHLSVKAIYRKSRYRICHNIRSGHDYDTKRYFIFFRLFT